MSYIAIARNFFDFDEFTIYILRRLKYPKNLDQVIIEDLSVSFYRCIGALFKTCVIGP